MSYYDWMKRNDNEHLIRFYFKAITVVRHGSCACPVVQHLGWEKARVVCHPPTALRLYVSYTGDFLTGWEPAQQACSPASDGTAGLNIIRPPRAGEGG